MVRLTLKRIIGGSMIFILAATLGAALTPEAGRATPTCDDIACRTFPRGCTVSSPGSYCHNYPSVDCFDGACQT